MQAITFNLNPSVSFVTTVSSQGGSTNNVATVSIVSAGNTLWSAVLIQPSPVGVTPELIIGAGAAQTIIHAGSNFTLTVPTSLMNGNVLANVTYDSAGIPNQTYFGQIGTWTLTQT